MSTLLSLFPSSLYLGLFCYFQTHSAPQHHPSNSLTLSCTVRCFGIQLPHPHVPSFWYHPAPLFLFHLLPATCLSLLLLTYMSISHFHTFSLHLSHSVHPNLATVSLQLSLPVWKWFVLIHSNQGEGQGFNNKAQGQNRDTQITTWAHIQCTADKYNKVTWLKW